MTNKIKIGVLGCSSIAGRSTIPAIMNSGRFELSHVASRSSERAFDFSDSFGCQGCGYEDIINNGDIEAVYISLPVGLHYEWGRKVVQSGKHLLMEKTFTDDLEKAKEIISIAGRKNIIAMENVVYIYHPLYKKIQALINSGEIGRLRHMEAFFGFPKPPKGNIRNKRDLGGGAMLDAMVYPLSFCLNTIPRPPKSWNANIIRDSSDSVDSRGFLQINWDDCSAQIGYGFGFMYRNYYLVWGEKGYLHADRVFSRPPDLKGDIVVVKQGKVDRNQVERADQFEHMVHAFADKISGKDQSGLNEKENVLERMKIISDLLKSYQKKGKISVQI